MKTMEVKCRDRRTVELVNKARFSKRYQGYYFLIPCVELVAEDETRLCALIKEIYQPVAKLYGVTYNDIERNMRTARDYAWRNGGKEFIEKISGGKFPDVPTMGEVLEILGEYLAKHR